MSMKKYLISAAAAFIAITATAQNTANDIYENWYLKTYTTAGDILNKSNDKDAGTSDKEIKERLAKMEVGIDMPYNDVVKQYIEEYTKNGRRNVPALLGYSIYYMPIFEQALSENGLPLVLKYLPIVESRLDPNAVSKSGAAGLWQFKVATAADYGMDVNDLVDERRDPYRSSEGACRLLKSLCDRYDGDWSLAIAAYNCGPGTLDKARARAGGDPKSHDFWSIYNYLPEETRGYVPKFIATTYVMTYYTDHNFDPVVQTQEFVTDSIHVTNRVHFDQISAVLDIPMEALQFLNPQFSDKIIPAFPNRPYNLILPSQQVLAYILSEDQILEYNKDQYAQLLEVTPGGDPRKAVKADPDDQGYQTSTTSYVAENQTPSTTTSRRRRHDAQPATSTPASEPVTTTTTRPSSSRRQTTSTQTAATPATTGKSTKRQTAAADATSASNSKKSKSGKNAGATATTATTAKNSKSGKNATAATTAKGAKGASAAATGKNAKQAKQAKPAAPAITSHAVKEGESLYVIAKKNGTTVEALRKANPKLKGDMIHPGDKLTVPKTQKAAAAPAKSTSTKAQAKTSTTGKSTAKSSSSGKSTSKSNTKTTSKKKK